MLSLGSIAGAIALVPGGGATVSAAASAIGYLVRCSTCLKILSIAVLIGWTALHVHRADVERCGERIEQDHREAAAAAAQRDAQVRKDLDNTFGPQLKALAVENQVLQQKVKDAKRKIPVARGCKLGAAAGVLQPVPAK
jgi:hypothetical protein